MALIKETLGLWRFAIMKIPMLFVANPRVVSLSKGHCEIVIPLNYWTRNHLGSLYFGVLAMGADCAGGLITMNMIERSKKPVQLVFKDFKAEFLRRAEGDVHFICTEGDGAMQALEQTIKTKKRVNVPLHIVATTPDKSGDEPVAKFVLTLSLKAK